ncbi:uncharacterized protein LOC132807791 [Hemiscyllium ocellatum]|uniref:uncharacterized protein LOC132807791 n=1 Tax=Hemiscyllium ocellatum TaxID=170820 RepID=UPI0029667AD8|nr:uncharacterized protein LOC132807791 [Hemiscyllium ocellatum]
MGGGGSKWRKVSAAAPGSIGEGTEAGGGQLPGQEGGGQHGAPRLCSGSTADSESSPSAAEQGGGVERELDRALAECWLAPAGQATPAASRRAGSHSSLGVRLGRAENGAAAAAGCQWESLLSCCTETVPGQHCDQTDPTAALSSTKLDLGNRNQPSPTYDLVTISTQDVKNNNLANGFYINGKNTSQNSTPILYDYFEEELMDSIVKEYS